MDSTRKAELVDCALRTERDRLRREAKGNGHVLVTANLLNRMVEELGVNSKGRLYDIIKRFETADEAYQALIEEGGR